MNNLQQRRTRTCNLLSIEVLSIEETKLYIYTGEQVALLLSLSVLGRKILYECLNLTHTLATANIISKTQKNNLQEFAIIQAKNIHKKLQI